LMTSNQMEAEGNVMKPEFQLKSRESKLFDWGLVNQLSIQVHIAAKSDEDYALISSATKQSVRIYSGITKGLEDSSIIAELQTDARPNPLLLSVPWDSIGSQSHDLLLSYNGYSVRLFVDGVLVDEDWPMGLVDLRDAAVTFGIGAEQGGLWKDAITPNSPEADLEEQYLGSEPSTIQYWKPRGHNTGVGDCMPYYDGDRFRIFYLFDRRGHASKWGLGAHQWAQSSTRDFSTWEHHPMAVGITEDWEGSICTGSVIQKDHIYYAFYAVRAIDGTPARLTWATSSDGVTFKKSEQYISLSDKNSLASVRDPHVFQDGEGKYHMLITTSLVDPVRNKGCLAHLTSDDLRLWEEQEPFIIPGYHDEPECSDYFEWNGWYYLIFSNDGLARYRYSRSPMGPWLRPAMDVFDCVQWRVPKTAPYIEGRRVAAGFLSSPGKYAGELVIRELVQSPNGELGTKLMPEVTEQPSASRELNAVHLDNISGIVYQDIDMEGESEYTISFRVTPDNANLYYGLSIPGANNFEDGYDIRFEPSRRKVGIHKAHSSTLQEDESASIYEVEDLKSQTYVEITVKPQWIDLCVNGSRTLISRIYGTGGPRKLRLFTQFGSAVFERISIGTFVDRI
jgi:beta-fructofuranosidase